MSEDAAEEGQGDKHIVVGAECRNSDCDWGPLGTDSPVLDWDIIERLRTQHEDDTGHQTRIGVVDEKRIVPSDSERFEIGDTVLSTAEERGEHVDWICPNCHLSGEELDATKRCPDCEERLKMVYPDGGEEVGRAIEDDVADALSTALDDLEREEVTAFILKQFAASKASTDLPAGLVPEGASALANLDIGFDRRVDADVLGDAVEAVVASRGEQSETGAHYTPDHVVEYINEETIDAQLQDALEPYTTTGDADDVSVLADHVPDGTKQAALAAIDDMCVLDPAMGSGHFLVDALARIAGVRRQVDDVTPLWRHRQRTAQRNLYGVDINGLAVEMTKLRVQLLVLEAIPTTAGGYPAIGGNSL